MDEQICKHCGENRNRHCGRSEMCPYDRRGEFDYRAKGLAWPEKSTWFEPAPKENYTPEEIRLLDEIDSHELDCTCGLCEEFVNAHNPEEWKATVRARLEVRSE